MAELSFIVYCDNNSDHIGRCIKSVCEVLGHDVDYEIVIINCADKPNITDILAKLEKKYNQQLLLVNCDEYVSEKDSFNIGLGYATGACFLKLSHDDILDSDTMNGVVYDASIIDENSFKYLHDKYIYIVQSKGDLSFRYDEQNKWPCLTDHLQGAGDVDKHYFYQDIYVAGKVLKSGIDHIYDIGSRLDGYISHLLSMGIHVNMIDIRPLPYPIENLDFIRANATDLSEIESDSIPVLSCLHAMEHFGLGRYGDTVDYLGWKKGFDSMSRVIQKGGCLYLSVPVGKREMVMFNAHRIFKPQTIINSAIDLKIQEFTLLHDGERTTFDFSREDNSEKISETLDYARNYIMGDYDCGIFVFRKV